MPCRCDYMDPDEREKESKLVCEHLKYVLDSLKMPIPPQVQCGLDDVYGYVAMVDKFTELLCELCAGMKKAVREKIIYDGHNPKARRLADWWEKHQELDAARQRLEKHS